MKVTLTTIPYTTKAMVFGVLPVPQHLEVIGTHAVRERLGQRLPGPQQKHRPLQHLVLQHAHQR